MSPELLERFAAIVGADNLHTDPADCWPYGYDNSRRQQLPAVVVFPSCHEQVVQLLRLCNEYRVPVTPRGRGTGTTGAAVPEAGGLVLSLERMDRILRLDADDRIMVVQPGVTNARVQEAAARHGLFWAPDPTSAAFCTVGGNLAYNSAGPRAVKYGTPRENVLGLRAVTGAGRPLRCGVRTTKGVVGYDLTRLLIGSEGTLAVITEATLKLLPLPARRLTLQAVYDDLDQAARAIAAIMGQPCVPYSLEFMDGQAIAMIRDYSQAPLPASAAALLLIEVEGLEDADLERAVAAIQQAARNPGLLDFQAARDEATAQALWATRKALSPALRRVAPKKINEDVVVPVSRLPELIRSLESLARRHALTIVNFGHAGNGNLHVNLLVDPDDPDQLLRAQACLHEVFEVVLSLEGTLSGEHGVGLEKRAFVARELDLEALALMQGLKALFDPLGILNPGKTLPALARTQTGV